MSPMPLLSPFMNCGAAQKSPSAAAEPAHRLSHYGIRKKQRREVMLSAALADRYTDPDHHPALAGDRPRLIRTAENRRTERIPVPGRSSHGADRLSADFVLSRHRGRLSRN